MSFTIVDLEEDLERSALVTLTQRGWTVDRLQGVLEDFIFSTDQELANRDGEVDELTQTILSLKNEHTTAIKVLKNTLATANKQIETLKNYASELEEDNAELEEENEHFRNMAL